MRASWRFAALEGQLRCETAGVTTTVPERSLRPGTARAAFAQRQFRIVWLGAFASNVGSWMQNVVLSAYAYERYGRSGTFVGLIVLAQLGPLLLAPVGGMIGDRFPRRGYLVVCQCVQLLFATWLAVLVMGARPAPWALVLTVLGIGVSNALNAPVFSAILPDLVSRENLQGAVSLNSTMINGSRVIGPLIVAVLVSFGATPSVIFLINAATFLFIIGALYVALEPQPRKASSESPVTALLGGFREAQINPIAGRLLLMLPLFSIVCLPYVGQFPTVAQRNLGTDPEGQVYQWLYATWALGACLGGLSIGTFLARVDKRIAVRWFFVGFGVSLAAYALTRQVVTAFPIVFLLGFTYFGVTTSMLTVLQTHIASSVRARVMALWFMGFGGSVPFGSYGGGWLMDHTGLGVSGVLLIGAGFALVLAWFGDLRSLSERARRL